MELLVKVIQSCCTDEKTLPRVGIIGFLSTRLHFHENASIKAYSDIVRLMSSEG